MLKRRIRKWREFFQITALSAVSVLFLSACQPTYPKEKLPEAIKKVCKDEYKMDVDVAIEGKTLGIFYPMKNLLDVSLGISEDSWERISNLILVASRVVLSTDAKIDFYCVITQDEKLPEMQVIIIKYVEDIKHGMYQEISRDESFKRTLFSVNLTPQARKERSIEKVFDKMGLEEKTRENVLNEFFRSEPTKMGDIGYWRGNFYLKDISLEEFLGAQIANRIKIDFRGEKELLKLYDYRASEGGFLSDGNGKHFIVKFNIFDQAVNNDKVNLHKRKIMEMLRIINEVADGYKFKDFNFVEMEDQIENVKFWVAAQDILSFNKKKTVVENVVKASGEYF